MQASVVEGARLDGFCGDHVGVSRGVIDVQASVVEGARLDGFCGDHGRAPQVGSDAGELLLNRKRLRLVVVGAGVERADLLRVLDARRDDDDGNGRPAADLVDDFDAIDVRQAASTRAEMTMMGTADQLRILLMTSTPSMSGRPRSSMIRSGLRDAASVRGVIHVSRSPRREG